MSEPGPKERVLLAQIGRGWIADLFEDARAEIVAAVKADPLTELERKVVAAAMIWGSCDTLQNSYSYALQCAIWKLREARKAKQHG